jgi:hypothetical protein
MTGGATDPALTAVTTAIGDLKTDIVMPVTYEYSSFITWLDSRFNYDNQILEGRLFLTEVDTKSNLVVTLTALNSASTVYFCDKPVATADKKEVCFSINRTKIDKRHIGDIGRRLLEELARLKIKN